MAGDPDNNPKTRAGRGKPPLNLVLSTGMLHMSMAQRSGDQDYGPMNWRDEPVAATIYVGALLRHLLKWYSGGIEKDPKSGAHELGHVMANAAIMMDAQDAGTLVDDRPTPNPRIAELIEELTREFLYQEHKEAKQALEKGLP